MQTSASQPPSSTKRSRLIPIGVGLIALFVTGIFANNYWQETRRGNSREIVIPVRDGVHSYTAKIAGDRIPSDQFAAIMLGETTTLAKETFVEVANGQIVEWVLKLEDVRMDSQDLLRGDFSVPVRFVDDSRTDHRRTDHRRLGVTGFFPAEERDSLLALQKGQFIEISGVLVINGPNDGDPVIRDARIKGDTSER